MVIFRTCFVKPFLLLLLFLTTGSIFAQCDDDQIVVVLSLDGFRWDYSQKTATPTLNLVAKEGVSTESLIPCFPSKTFPNHYTIATGLYPAHHGLVNNSFYDPALGESYAILNKEARFNADFYKGEPIWITAQKQGLLTASYNWVGSEVPIQDMCPDYWKDYDGGISLIQRIDTIINWLEMPENLRPRLIMAYYHEPDGVGHTYGPDDARTLNRVHELDSLTGILYNRIKALPNANCINFIVLSDHGMGNIDSERNIVLNDLIPESWNVRIEGGNPMYNIYVKSPVVDSVYQRLKVVPHMQVWKAGEVPAHLNYTGNPRIGDIVIVADSAWSITRFPPKKAFTGGAHGYDPRNKEMHTIFYAAGPAFKQGYVQPAFQNIHIYPLLAYLLGIVPVKTDGDLEQVEGMLRRDN
ncbi:MAG: ectonucleotide pyrophosphatase/phosphodiesterase [Lentimicrobium sp.]|jgi:alkaline phosphatase D|nr:ectonucleotide pyrophosphatase/phosphodiesterase [Lentimicrobium sp.]